MKEFAVQNPWLTVLFVVPSLLGGVVGLVHAARAPKKAKAQ